MDEVNIIENPFIGIVIINYNGLEDTLECLDSISKISYKNYKIFLVDNASSSNDLEKIKYHYPKHCYIQSDENCGFSGANNLGIKQALLMGVDNILLLNNDTTVTPDFLQPLVKSLNGKNNIGMVTPQICYSSFPDTIWMSGGVLSKSKGTGFQLKIDDKVIKSSTTEKISFVSGCCALIKSEVLYNVGLWAEEYFLYVEDVDYSYRVKKAGYSMLLVNESIIYHKINASTGKNNSRLPIYYTVRNRLYFSMLHFDIFSIIAIIYIIFTTILKILFWKIADEKKQKYASLALFDFFKGKMGKMNKQIEG